MLRALQGNAVVALLCDRDVTGAGVQVRFFGETTRLPAGPAMFALRSGAPLLPVAVPFTAAGYAAVVRPPVPMPEVPRKEAVHVMTQALAVEFEALIRATPEQWHLLQPNWPSDTVESA
jgi:KDO2-lipid IV(A) lauroyltransferase